MSDAIRTQLGAYLDGELDPRKRASVEAHLATCRVCQAELAELRQLSHLLQAAPLPEFTPARDFKAQLMLQLPRRAQAADPHASERLLPWLAPAAVLAGWLFVQIVMGLSWLVSLLSQSGLLGGALAWAAPVPEQMLWFNTAQAAIGGALNPQGQVGLQILNDAGVYLQNAVVILLVQVGTAMLYWGALTLVFRNNLKTWWTSLTTE